MTEFMEMFIFSLLYVVVSNQSEINKSNSCN